MIPWYIDGFLRIGDDNSSQEDYAFENALGLNVMMHIPK